MLLVAGVQRRHGGAQKLALFTLAGTAAKLLLVDMARVDAFWRILLFMGFGAGFLALSWYLKAAVSFGGSAGHSAPHGSPET